MFAMSARHDTNNNALEKIARLGLLVALLAASGITLAQDRKQPNTPQQANTLQQVNILVINGYRGEAPIRRMDGRAYVDLETLAQITSGSLTFQGNRVLLTLPSAAAATAPPATSAAKPPVQTGFSTGFRMAAIEAVAAVREWVTTLAVAMQNGYPIGGAMASYRSRASDALSSASVAASTDADRRGLQLLSREFNAAQALSGELVSARNSMGAANFAVSPDAMNNYPAFQQIVHCGQSLGAMLVSGIFEDATPCR